MYSITIKIIFMKKIFTLFFGVVILSAAAFAQDGGRHRANKRDNKNSYQYQYQQNDEHMYGSKNEYGNNWSQDRHDKAQFDHDQKGFDSYRRDRDANDMMYKGGRYNNWSNKYHQKARKRVSFKLIFGNRHSRF